MGFLYKKCEVCSENISKLQCLVLGGFNPSMKCKNCGTEYKIIKTGLYNFIDSIALEASVLLSLFCAFAISFYIDKDFIELSGIYFFSLVALLALLFLFFVASLLYALFILLFVAKFEIKENNIENKQSNNIFSKFFSNKDKR